MWGEWRSAIESVWNGAYSESRLHVLLCTYCGVCCVCFCVPLFSYSAKSAFSYGVLNLPFLAHGQLYMQFANTLFSDIAKGCIFSSLLSFGDLGMLYFDLSGGLDQWPSWVVMLEDAPWFAKRFCFTSWTSFSPLWICFLSAVVPH